LYCRIAIYKKKIKTIKDRKEESDKKMTHDGRQTRQQALLANTRANTFLFSLLLFPLKSRLFFFFFFSRPTSLSAVLRAQEERKKKNQKK
jgi:hypothetical protein